MIGREGMGKREGIRGKREGGRGREEGGTGRSHCGVLIGPFLIIDLNHEVERIKIFIHVEWS